jgi:uncharacterized membrane protein
VLIFLVLLGAGLRLYDLGGPSLWNDELGAWTASSKPGFAAVIADVSRNEVHPPGYFLLLHLVIRWLGESEVWLRLPSALAGVLCVPLIYLLGLRIYGPWEGLLAAALMSAGWTAVDFSRMARANILVLLFAMLAALLWWSELETWRRGERPSRGSRVALTVVAVVCAYLHYFGLAFVVLLACATPLFLARRRPGPLPGALLPFGLTALAYAPWIPRIVQQYRGQRQYISWIEPPVSFTASLFDFLVFALNMSAVAAVVALGLGAVHLLRLVLRRREDSLLQISRWLLRTPGAVLLGWLLTPVAATYIESTLFTPLAFGRNLLICLPAVYLLLARTLASLPWPRRALSLAPVLFAGLLTVHLVVPLRYYSAPHRPQFREAVRFIIDQSPTYPDALIIGYALRIEYLDYYFARLGSTLRTDLLAGPGDVARVREALAARRPRFVWYICAGLTPPSEITGYLDRELRRVGYKQLLFVHIWLYANPQAVAPAGG